MRAPSLIATTLFVSLMPLLAFAEEAHDHGPGGGGRGGGGRGGGGGGSSSLVDAWLDGLWHPKFITMLVIGLVVIVLIKTRLMNKPIKVALLLVSTFLFGVAANIPVEFFGNFAMHPSPICAFTKPLMFGMRPGFVVTMGVIVLLTLVGPKLFCGWICPVGAVQELISMLSEKLKIKVEALPFRFTNTVRIGFVIAFVALTLTGLVGRSLYDYVNAFHGLEIEAKKSFVEWVIHYVPFLLTIALAFKTYRPFCYLLCPVGLVAHALEQIGLLRVTLDADRCPPGCTKCRKESLCPTVPDILQASQLRPDCFACNRCVDACPSGALTYGLARRKGKRQQKAG